jgi:heme-degrading monooxygenase HmoA
MVTIGMNYLVRAGKEQVFEDAFRRVLDVMREMEGHDVSRLYREVGDGARSYLIVSRWRDEDAFRSFVRSERFAKVTNWGSEHVLEGPPRHTTYRE